MSSKPILCSSYNESVQKYTEYIKNHVNLVKLSGLRFFKEIVDKVIIPRRYGIVFKSDFSDEIIHNLILIGSDSIHVLLIILGIKKM